MFSEWGTAKNIRGAGNGAPYVFVLSHLFGRGAREQKNIFTINWKFFTERGLIFSAAARII